MKLFDKLKSNANRLFDKVKSGAPKILGKVSSGLKQSAGVVNQFEGIGRALTNDATVQKLAGKNNSALNQAKSVFDSGLSTNILNNVSGLTNANNYKGDAEAVTNNILERAKKIGQDIQDSTGSKMEFV